MPEITLVILAFKSSNELSLVAYTIFSHVIIHKKSNRVKSGKRGSHEDQSDFEKNKNIFLLIKNCCKFCGKELFNNYT